MYFKHTYVSTPLIRFLFLSTIRTHPLLPKNENVLKRDYNLKKFLGGEDRELSLVDLRDEMEKVPSQSLRF